MRLTFNYPDNDVRMASYVNDRMGEIAKAMNPQRIVVSKQDGSYSIVPYQSTHTCGGAVMGTDPKTSVLNRYLQSWDVPNVFVMGASASRRTPATTRPAPSPPWPTGRRMPSGRYT